LIVSFTQPKFGSLADKIGRKPLIAASAASFFLFPLFYAFAKNWLHLAAVHAVLGFSMASFSVSSTSYILDSAAIGRRGTYTGAYNLVFGFASFLGSFAGGTFADYLSAANGVEQVVFIGLVTSAIMRLMTSVGFMTIKETLPKRIDVEAN
jgi:MFS family permease